MQNNNYRCTTIIYVASLLLPTFTYGAGTDLGQLQSVPYDANKPSLTREVPDLRHPKHAASGRVSNTKALHRTSRQRDVTVLRWDTRNTGLDTERPVSPSLPLNSPSANMQVASPIAMQSKRSVEFALSSNNNSVTQTKFGEPDPALATTHSDFGVLGSVKWKW